MRAASGVSICTSVPVKQVNRVPGDASREEAETPTNSPRELEFVLVADRTPERSAALSLSVFVLLYQKSE